ncbi:CaiB/BaiF CoA transferase family protein [Sphingomonas prati]|uniref:Crotonobetainyl-CoA:carnitine CoA-transferase CaiB-like acyl-CoA transferase n=1 Tax=Sphingomonas prati TaxID=1843237 RepID=A0A7W9F4A0_9SPHN|nr:CoA transferase [Sphingomonas prati]MBB5730280.1 crotonobetainyl-CoA:carnitine CoA-transferase CaiB-like acyl-CoA transferase [Sphingomonas prati]GGE92881.1 CoA transferase [Sphingomonas prati]
MTQPSTGPLAGLRVLDLSRVLAGPWSTQILGDLGADVVKIEEPGQGDDTRRWGPPFLDDGSRDSAYYLCANRNKRSVAIDMADPRGADLIRRLAADSDIVVENFRVGGLVKYGLDYASLSAATPGLIYCSITGFGQDGPYRDRGGYDFMIQGMSGLMSVTGRPDDEPGGGPMKVGVPITDLTTGLYATVSILAALAHRDRTGIGQHIDMALLDTQVALLANQASSWLNGGVAPVRRGNDHPGLVPYRDYACADGDILVALGNDRQFRAFCTLLRLPDLATDPRFADNAARNAHRAALQSALAPAIATWRADDLLAAMDVAGLPAGRVNTIPDILADPHIAARGLVQPMTRADGTPVQVLGYPGKFSETPADYLRAPPRSGEDSGDVLRERLGLHEAALAELIAAGVVAERLR